MLRCDVARGWEERGENQDAFTIVRVPVVTAVVCDGAGNAELAARRVTGLLELWLANTTLGQASSSSQGNSALLGGSECTLAAVQSSAPRRAALWSVTRASTSSPKTAAAVSSEPLSKARLGSGDVEPTSVRHQMAPHDILLLVTDGAWTPLGPARLERAARKAALVHFSDVPPAILDAAGQRGRADDMGAVAIRLASH